MVKQKTKQKITKKETSFEKKDSSSCTKAVQGSSKLERLVSLIGYMLVGVFFIVLYILMTMTYEDLSQSASDMALSPFGILSKIYHYLPRIGEFFQRIAMHYMTYQVSFGSDLFFRLLFALFAFGVIYFATVLVLARRPKLSIKDALVFSGVFCATILTAPGIVFMQKFAFAANYALATLTLLIFMLPFRIKFRNNSIVLLIFFLANGFIFGTSSEIAPVAAIIVAGAMLAYKFIKNKKISLHQLWINNKIQLLSFLGMFLGMIFFYLGGGIGGRTGGIYGEVYAYLSPFDLITSPLRFVNEYISHLWYNLRYFLPIFVTMSLGVILEFYVLEKNSSPKKESLFQAGLLSFSVLYFCGTSLILLYDDIYDRMLMSIYLIAIISLFSLLKNIFCSATVKRTALSIFAICCILIEIVAILDMTYAFIKYRQQVAQPDLGNVVVEATSDDIIDDNLVYNGYIVNFERIPEFSAMPPSFIFHFQQYTPFDWGDGWSRNVLYKHR